MDIYLSAFPILNALLIIKKEGSRVLFRSFAVFSLAFFLFTCGLSFAAANEVKTAKLRLGMTGIEPGMAGIWMAKDKGFFAKEDIDVELIDFTNGTDGIFALASGDLQVVDVGGPAAARGIVAGIDVKFIAQLLDSLPYVLFVSPNINTSTDLIGKRIGISGFGGASEFVTRLILARFKLDTTQVSILQMGEESTRLAALQAGSVDATILLPPCTTIARKLGFKELPGGNVEGIRGQEDFLVASGRTLVEHRDWLLRLLRAILKGDHYFKTHPDEGRACLAKYLQIEDPEALAESYESYEKLFTRNGSVNTEGIQNLLDFIEDPRARELKPANLIDTTLISELDKNGDIERINKQ
jgi:NitT/TauT family transport system substrate-binding protein